MLLTENYRRDRSRYVLFHGGALAGILQPATYRVYLLVRTAHHKEVLLVLVWVEPDAVRHLLVCEP